MTLRIPLSELLASKSQSLGRLGTAGPNDPIVKPEMPDEPRQNPDQPSRTPDESPAQYPTPPDMPVEFT